MTDAERTVLRDMTAESRKLHNELRYDSPEYSNQMKRMVDRCLIRLHALGTTHDQAVDASMTAFADGAEQAVYDKRPELKGNL